MHVQRGLKGRHEALQRGHSPLGISRNAGGRDSRDCALAIRNPLSIRLAMQAFSMP